MKKVLTIETSLSWKKPIKIEWICLSSFKLWSIFPHQNNWTLVLLSLN